MEDSSIHPPPFDEEYWNSNWKLRKACQSGDNHVVQTILATERFDVNWATADGDTPLMLAMEYNHTSVVTTLLAYPDTRLDCTNRSGRTGLHYACRNNRHSVVAISGQDRRCTAEVLNIRDIDVMDGMPYGITPLMLAVEWGHLECVKEMGKLEGTDFQTKNSQGETLIEVARKNNHAAVVQYLEERGALVAAEVATNTWERTNQVAEDVATNALERMDLRDIRDIAEELGSLDSIDAVMASEEEIMKTRHESEKDTMQRRHDEENKNMTNQQNREVAEHERIVQENRVKRSILVRRLQSRLSPAVSGVAPSPDIP